MSSDIVVPSVERRGVLGRLYHGETAIDFYGRRFIGLTISAILILVTIVSLFGRGLNLGLDFTGGVAWEVSASSLTVDEARDVLDANGIDGTDAKILERSNASGSSLLVQVGDQSQEVRQAVQGALAEAAGVSPESVSVSSVSSTWGRSITEKAIRALVIFLIFVAAFISWRLEWRMALAAIAAMVHDVLISVGIYSLFGFEVTPATIVAFLTILGFSLYDTIVVFDKVRENSLAYAGTRAPFADVMNVSMNQVLMRSLNTSLAAVLPVLSLLVLGAGVLGAVTLAEFSLALLVGLLTGSYSSIFIAAPLLTMMHEREPKYRKLRGTHATGTELERLVLGGAPGARAARRAAQDSTGESSVAQATAVELSADAVLTHAPRPRKKKQRDR
jgi:preprotein translocase subunit SecF